MAYGRIDFTKMTKLPGALVGPTGHFKYVLCRQKEPYGTVLSVKVSKGTARDKEVFCSEAWEAFLTPRTCLNPLILEFAERR